MLIPYSSRYHAAFLTACSYERVFGSKIRSALAVYGEQDPHHRFFLALCGERPAGALYLKDDVLIISADATISPNEVASLIREMHASETDCSLALCEQLSAQLGGDTESSYYMVYEGTPIQESFPDITPASLPDVYQVLLGSHEYYRTHLQYEPWAFDLQKRMDAGETEVYQLTLHGSVIATGSLYSQDEECGVLAAIAVLPQYRHQGLGSRMSRFLVQRILALGKTPRLIAGYDEVAELYRQVGFVPCGRWGELYL